VVHGFLAALQVIQQRAVGRGELAAEVLARLEQASGAPAMQGPLAHAQTISGLALHGPVEGMGHRCGCEGQELLGSEICDRSISGFGERGWMRSGMTQLGIAAVEACSHWRLRGTALTTHAMSGLLQTDF